RRVLQRGRPRALVTAPAGLDLRDAPRHRPAPGPGRCLSQTRLESHTCRPTREIMKTFEELFAELSEKAQTRPAGSGTVAALDAGVHAIGKKVVEEAAESWMAAEYESNDRAAEEISQLLYHVQVLMIAKGIGLDEVYKHL